ncbi:MAG: ribonuclease III [Holophagales bacterium]|nr:ribonuclease III [Holophagales bacterium]
MSEKENLLETSALLRLEVALGHRFSDRSLPALALTHSSYSNERGFEHNYERLEFLGDSVLGLLTSEWLFHRFPDEPEGRLAKLKSFLVSAPVLAEYARALGLGELLLLGVGEERSGGRDKPSILADVLEAFYGALYLDGGLRTVRPVVERGLERGLEGRRKVRHADAKTRLQELTQASGLGLPEYRLIAESGPDHDKRFRVECHLDAEHVAVAEGRSKKAAEQAAAAAVLGQLDLPQGGS